MVRNVARIEPLVEPSQFWVTERFKEALEQTPSFYRAEPIDPGVRAEVRSEDGTFNVKKAGSTEEDHYLRLFRIVEPRREIKIGAAAEDDCGSRNAMVRRRGAHRRDRIRLRLSPALRASRVDPSVALRSD